MKNPPEIDLGEATGIPEFRGVKAHVDCESAIADAGTILVCTTVITGEPAFVRASIVLNCSLCRSEVWASPSTVRILAYGKNNPVLCTRCAVAIFKSNPV